MVSNCPTVVSPFPFIHTKVVAMLTKGRENGALAVGLVVGLRWWESGFTGRATGSYEHR